MTLNEKIDDLLADMKTASLSYSKAKDFIEKHLPCKDREAGEAHVQLYMAAHELSKLLIEIRDLKKLYDNEYVKN